MDWDVLIVGGGPAGMTAAIYAGRAGWKTSVFDPLGGGGQASVTDTIHNYPGFPSGIQGAELMDLMAKQAQTFGVTVDYDQVMDVKRQGDIFHVTCESSSHTTRTVIYAAGTSPRKLGVPGEEKFIGRGVSFCATCDGALFKDKVVAVVGGGDSALTEAEFLTRFASEVLLIHRRDEFRAGLATVRRIMSNSKVKRLMSSAVEEVRGEEQVKSILVRDLAAGKVSEIAVDGLFLYVGSDPNSAPIKDLVETNEGGYVITGEDMSTRTPGLFVAGDVRHKSLRQVATAVGDGAVAAWSAERYLLENQSEAQS
ncbi:MAG: thioredoxin-disulfide reductase [Bacillota bacterium]